MYVRVDKDTGVKWACILQEEKPSMREREGGQENERKSESEREWEWEREWERVCMCVWEREREREGGGRGREEKGGGVDDYCTFFTLEKIIDNVHFRCTCGTAFGTCTSVLGGLGGGVSCTRTFLTPGMDSILIGTGGNCSPSNPSDEPEPR